MQESLREIEKETTIMLEKLEEIREDRLKTSCCHLQRMNCESDRYQGGYGANNPMPITDHTSTGWSLVTERWPSNGLGKVKGRLLAEELSKTVKKLPTLQVMMATRIVTLCRMTSYILFYVLLTVHLSIILVINQLNAQILVL